MAFTSDNSQEESPPTLLHKVEEDELKYLIWIELPVEVQQKISTIETKGKRGKDASIIIKCSCKRFVLDVLVVTAMDGTILLAGNFTLPEDVDQARIYSAIWSDTDPLLVVLPKANSDYTEESSIEPVSPLRQPRKFVMGIFDRGGQRGKKGAEMKKMHYAETVIHP